MGKLYDNKQRAAINASNGHYLVLAPPGCGKTDILTERIVRAHSDGVAYEDMLCLTFTNRASRGMKNRITQRLGEDASQIYVGNVHRFCSNFLFSNALIPENTSIIDETDQADILMTLDNNYFSKDGKVPDKNAITEVCNLSAYIAQRRLGQPQHAIFAETEMEQFFKMTEGIGFDAGKVPVAFPKVKYALQYINYKRERFILDFDDILITAYEHLRNDPHEQFRRFPWLQVDEVQDLNPLQMAIVDELTEISGNFTAMYLGDEQQAIFSFLGAKMSLLQQLKERCKGNILHLERNYRSPKYLLDVFNTYAEKELGVDPVLLPTTDNDTPKGKYDLLLARSETSEQERERITSMVKFYNKFPDERLAILVPTNAMADAISNKLTENGYDNFKISGTDLFKTKAYKTLSSFFSVLNNEFCGMAWVRLLYGIGAVETQNLGRRFVLALQRLMMTPFDIIEGQSYVERFNKIYETQEMVFFDTETTGLNVLEDDIVQIAAFKVRHGRKVEGSDFNILLHTSREIPKMLGNIVNPLEKEYAANKHYDRREGLQMFLDYIGYAPLLGHNVLYDYNILQSNVRRELGKEVVYDVYDSLKLIRCIRPNLRCYKLEYLISELGLEGKNSHLANEDVEATRHLVDYCYNASRDIVAQQRKFIQHEEVQRIAGSLGRLKTLFGEEKALLSVPLWKTGRHIAHELKRVYDLMNGMKLIEPMGGKFSIFLKYAESEWTANSQNETLGDQISAHINDMTASLSEGDLINSEGLVKERIFVMTVHKGKGLEFENVILLNAVDGSYPFFTVKKILQNRNSHSPEEVNKAMRERKEDARKFYVAISRAKKRLCISYSVRNNNNFSQERTPFLRHILPYFLNRK